MIEREIPSIGGAEEAEFRAIARRSNETIRNIGPDIQWIESHVTADKIFCVYLATGEEVIRAHAERSGFPADKIMEISAIIDPATPWD